MCIRDSLGNIDLLRYSLIPGGAGSTELASIRLAAEQAGRPVSYTHLRAHETVLELVCRLLLDKKTY